MIDLRQTPEYAKYMEAIGWQVDKSPGFYAYIRKIPVLGNFVKLQRPEKLSYQSIDSLIVKYKPFQIVVEPKYSSHISQLTTHNFRQSRTYFVPTKTVQIDLTKTEKQLLKEMHYKTRYNIKKVESYKLKVESSQNIKSFADFWQSCALKQRGMFIPQNKEIEEIYNAFGKNAYVILVTPSVSLRESRLDGRRSNLPNRSHFLQQAQARNDNTYNSEVSGFNYSHPDNSERIGYSFISGSENQMLKQVQHDKILAGVLLLCTKDMAYYMYAAATDEGKKLFAPTLAAWEAIKLAKRLKKKVFDFEGIYDERFPLKSWLGFTRFKKSFGGKEIEDPGTYSKLRLPF